MRDCLGVGPACAAGAPSAVGWRDVVNAGFIALVVTLVATAGSTRAHIASRSDTAITAAFLFNFAKFTEWRSLQPAAPLTLCVVGDGRIASALVETVRGQRISERPIEVKGMGRDGPVQSCHLLFISNAETRSARPVLDTLKSLPILTVSDGRGFAKADGIIELFIESERMRFAINPGAAERAGLHLSSRLLGLARIERNDHVE